MKGSIRMADIKVKNLTFAYDGQLTPLFKKVNLNIGLDWKLGLLGRNGQGKTTFLKLFLGELAPNGGQIERQTTFQYFPLKIDHPSYPTIMAIQDNYPIEKWKLKKELSKMCSNSDELIWRPYAELSGGEQTKVQLATLFKNDDVFPLVDEPTNHLDGKSRKQIADYLKHKKQGFIVVSHDVAFLNQIIDHVLSIERNTILQFHGNFDTYKVEKENQDQNYLEENQKLKSEIKRLRETSREKKDWAVQREKDNYGNPHVKGSGGTGHSGFTSARAKRSMKRSKAIQKRIDQKIKQKQALFNNIIETSPLTINYIPSRKDEILSFKDFQLGYDFPLFDPVTFTLKCNEQLIVTGQNGIGKSTLFKFILNQVQMNSTGDFHVNPHAKISYLSQSVKLNGTIMQLADQNGLNFNEILNLLRKLGMPREVFNLPIEQMSKGQQKKVALAKSLVEPANLYLWDEPLNYLDIENQQQILTMIKEKSPTMLIVEHDQKFINSFDPQFVKCLKR